MNTRRKFIINGSFTAAAMLAAKPFKAIAGTSSFFEANAGKKYIVLMHTAGTGEAIHPATMKFIKAVQGKTNKALFLDNTITNKKPMEVIDKGGVRTGIINISSDNIPSAIEISEMADVLRKEKNCKVIVCISSIGYNHKSKVGDRELAAASEGIDVFIGTNPNNFTAHTRILHNRKKHEVILQSAFSDNTAFGKVEIGFDEFGNKNHIHVLNTIPLQNRQQQNAIVAA